LTRQKLDVDHLKGKTASEEEEGAWGEDGRGSSG